LNGLTEENQETKGEFCFYRLDCLIQEHGKELQVLKKGPSPKDFV